MTHNSSWSPYAGSASFVLALILLLIAGGLLYAATRFSHPLTVKRPGPALGILLVVIWVLSLVTFVVAVVIYVETWEQQNGPFTSPVNPITPVTLISGVFAFVAINYLTRQSGFWVAFGSAIVGTIAAPMIFEFPFDLIVMARTYPPAPEVLFTLLFFFPLFLVEASSFALLLLSPVMKLSSITLVLLAGMFAIFAVWALFGFAYPSAPIPIALNMLSKVVAFATAVSLFLPPGLRRASMASVA